MRRAAGFTHDDPLPGFVGDGSRLFAGSSAIDFSFALAVGALFLGDIIGPLPSMAFILATGFFALIHVSGRFDFRRLAEGVPIPLLIFLALHISLSLVVSVDNFVNRLVQASIAIIFTSLTYYRYRQVSMVICLKYTSIIIAAIMAYTVFWHFSQGIFMPLKYLLETKTLFSLFPLVILFIWTRRDPSRRKAVFWRAAVSLALVLVLLMSGERKAYLTMAISLPFLIDLRRPASLGIILGLVTLVAIASAVDSSGYIARQLDTLFAFGQGRVANTVSNLTREWQLHHALATFRENPLWGVGTNGYSGILKSEYLSASKSQMVILPEVGIHGEGLRVLVENGIIGLSALVLLIAYSVWVIISPVVRGQARWADRVPPLLMLFAIIFYLGFEAFDMTAMVFYGLLPILGRLRWPEVGPHRTAMQYSRRRPSQPAIAASAYQPR